MDIHEITSSFAGAMAFTTMVNGHQLTTDATLNDGGLDSGPSPKKLMLIALAGCTGIDVVSILNKMKIPFSDLSIHIHAKLSDDNPRIYNEVKISYHIKMEEINRDKMNRAVKLSEEKYCGVSAMFRSFAEMSHHINFL